MKDGDRFRSSARPLDDEDRPRQGRKPRQPYVFDRPGAQGMFMLHSSIAANGAVRRTFSDAKALRTGMAPSVSQDVARAGQRGLTGAIRRLWPGESAAFRDHLLRLDPESRRSRFGAPVAPCFVERYAARAVSPKSIVYGYVVDGTVRAAAELRPAAHPFSAEAEAALSVERDWQDRGVGSALLERVILAAQNRGIRTVRLNCLVNNFRMRALAKKYEAVLRFRAGDVVGELANPTATPLSLLRESVAEWNGIAATILDWQMRALRAA